MARARSPNRDKAKIMYLESNGEKKLKDIAEELGLKDSQIRKWKSQDKWDQELKGALPKTKGNVTNEKKRKKGGQIGNKNALGNDGGAPEGNINAIKHGAYQSLYANMLRPEEKEIFDQTTASVNIDEEIRLLRLKIARLLNREVTFFYDMYGNKHEKEINEEDRENGILICMEQLRKLIETKASLIGDTEKLQMDREKFEFNKYKTEIEIDLKREKLELEKAKVNDEEGEYEDDGFIDALKGEVSEVWDDVTED
ncbi:phage terminase small subunit [Anaeromicrobium sediminis]|uniref:Terminase n=1 Tax=Anaeromicrobium sediminis TaxID=1478221 RepID=A0A267MRG5_9FIRM|nr:phage terminase small subunit [Anaeromicrobium sediminis]PAB61330.1 terminase [Anaeromicrobium sediminis]